MHCTHCTQPLRKTLKNVRALCVRVCVCLLWQIYNKSFMGIPSFCLKPYDSCKLNDCLLPCASECQRPIIHFTHIFSTWAGMEKSKAHHFVFDTRSPCTNVRRLPEWMCFAAFSVISSVIAFGVCVQLACVYVYMFSVLAFICLSYFYSCWHGWFVSCFNVCDIM